MDELDDDDKQLEEHKENKEVGTYDYVPQGKSVFFYLILYPESFLFVIYTNSISLFFIL